MKICEIIGEGLVKKTKFHFNGKEMDYTFNSSPILWHGTSIARAEKMTHIEPRIGDFIRDCYPRAKMSPLVFAADEYSKSKIWSACRFAVGAELGIDRIDVTVSEFIENAAVIKIETDRSKFQQATRFDKPHRGVEKYDFFADSPVKIDEIIQGDALFEFFGETFLKSYLRFDNRGRGLEESLIDEPHLYYYHVTPTRNLKSISANGLVPQKGRRSKKIGEESDGIYLFYNLTMVEDAINGWLGLEFTESSRLALLRVTVPEGSGVRYGGMYERIITTPIPAENIKVLTRDLFGEVGLDQFAK